MKIFKYITRLFETNVYVAVSEAGNAALIDPGGSCKAILSDLEGLGVAVKKILLTHGHYDHTKDVAEIAGLCGAEVYIHSADGIKLEKGELSLPHGLHDFVFTPFSDYKTIKEGDIIELDELEFLVYHTPGHTEGSVVFGVSNRLFTGDTLFRETIGATADETADYDKLLLSVKRLSALFPGKQSEIKILPGHGGESTLQHEIDHNPYI